MIIFSLLLSPQVICIIFEKKKEKKKKKKKRTDDLCSSCGHGTKAVIQTHKSINE